MKTKKIRYAVVGLGDIAQSAVLPAFASAKNSELTALISDDPAKLRQLARRYGVKNTCHYNEYEGFMRSGLIDAVYICLPNQMHCEYAIRAAQAGIHILSEKPLAVDEEECQQIIKACSANRIKLMTAYRLHFQRANLEAIDLLHSGKLGDIRIFQSMFTMQVKAGNVRTAGGLGSGTLYDIGVYCINASRYLFRDEPQEVFAYSARNDDPRFKKIDEMTSAVLRFPKDRLASFTCSFGAADSAIYTVMGTKGWLRLNQAYEYTSPMEMEIHIGERTEKRKYSLSDQFAAELVYFSDCILRNREPEPSGIEGLLDVHIIRSLYQSASSGLPVRIKELRAERHPSLRQNIYRPPAKRAPKVHASSPSR